MEKKALIDAILEKEWPMFHNVNGEERADCQDDRRTFTAMRTAQYAVWSNEALESYLGDVEKAEREGRNLAREKYIRMMATTAPEGYEHFRGELGPDSEEKKQTVAAIWAILLRQTEKMREKYPLIALGGRPLRISDEKGGATSVENYQCSELMTYSEGTLRALLREVERLEAEGKSFAWKVQENSVLSMGYPSMEEAEKAMLDRLLQEMDATVTIGGCPSCGDDT